MVPVASAVDVTADSRHVHRDRRRRAARSGCAGACGVGAGGSSTSGCDSVIRWPGGKCFGGLSPEARGHTVAAPATTHMRSRQWPCPRPAPTASVRQSHRGSHPEPCAARPERRPVSAQGREISAVSVDVGTEDEDNWGSRLHRPRGEAMETQPLEHATFDKPDEVREGDNWRLELLNLAGGCPGRQDHRPTRLAVVRARQAGGRNGSLPGAAPAVPVVRPYARRHG
jgi:hypothetical protein